MLSSGVLHDILALEIGLPTPTKHCHPTISQVAETSGDHAVGSLLVFKETSLHLLSPERRPHCLCVDAVCRIIMGDTAYK